MKPIKWQSCNVLHSGTFGRRLWQFARRDPNVQLVAEETRLPSEPLSRRLVARSWSALWHRRLNLAWLPADSVFLRVVELPPADASELPAMIELQLERLSPLPITQIVWSCEILEPPSPEHAFSTMLVAIAARSKIEAFLGELESAGFLADTLDLPLLAQLASYRPGRDATCLFPLDLDGRRCCFTTWWYGQRLRHVELLHVGEGDAAWREMAEALAKTAWAGETEGWLPQAPAWIIIADATISSLWQSSLSQQLGAPVSVQAAIASPEAAAASARRHRGTDARINLLPEDYATRYRQQFIDQLWMKGILSIAGVYLVGVLIYLVAVQVLDFQKRALDRQLAAITPSYQRAMELKAKQEVLEEQVRLRFAALDCLKATSELLPEELTLTKFKFEGGMTVLLEGNVPADDQKKITEFNSALKKVEQNGQTLFGNVTPPSTMLNRGITPTGVSLAKWGFNAELKRATER